MVDNAVVAVGTGAYGLGQITMISYIIEFLVGFAIMYLAVYGAVKLWDVLSTTYYAIRTDLWLAKTENITIWQLYKDRVAKLRHAPRKA